MHVAINLFWFEFSQKRVFFPLEHLSPMFCKTNLKLLTPYHRWSCTQKSEMSLADLPQYNLEYQLKKIKEEHVRYISRLALCSNSSVVGSSTHPTNQSKQNQDNQARNHYALALKGLQLLSSWTAVVMEVYSWKLVNPCDHRNG